MTVKQKAIFPDYPRDPVLVDNTGVMHSEWELAFTQLFQALQFNYKPEGLSIPQKTATEISQLTGSQSVGNIIYDSTNNVFKANVLVLGVPTWKTINLV